MSKPSLVESAKAVVAWLDTVSDKELFEELSKCDSTIAYAIDYRIGALDELPSPVVSKKPRIVRQGLVLKRRLKKVR